MRTLRTFNSSIAALGLATALLSTQRCPAVIAWTPVADNCGTPAQTQNCPLPVDLQPYLKFDPPVMPQYAKMMAYKAWIRPGPSLMGTLVTTANDEGVWGTGPYFASTGTLTTNPPTLILREGDATSTAIGAPTYGNSGSLAIGNLQMSIRGDTLFQANLSTTGGKASLHDNCCLQIMAQAVTSAWTDLRPPVVDWTGEKVAEWLWQNNANNGIMRFDYASGIPLPPCDPNTPSWSSNPSLSSTIAPGGVGLFRPTPAPIGSPTIGERGVTLFYAVDNAAPVARRPHLRFRTAGVVQGIVNRSRDLVPAGDLRYPGGYRLGTYAPKLLCVVDTSAASMLDAWQMSAMITPGGVTVVEPSLWVQRVGGINVPECFVKQGDAAPGTSSTFASFYEMQAVFESPNTLNRWVIFGANLTSGARAIYMIKVPQVGALGSLTLVATDDPGVTIVTPITGSPTAITTLQPWFSVDLIGNIVFTANCLGLPVGSQQVLCTASIFAPAPVVQSQQGLTIPTLTSGPAIIRRFDLAKPDQGVLSRGQAINGKGDYAARILFRYINTSGVSANGEGVYFGQ